MLLGIRTERAGSAPPGTVGSRVTDERRYSEDEVSEIFSRAAEVGEARLPALREPEGLTLAELQAVGEEVGLAPERVAHAAAALDARGELLPRRSLLGAPVSVGRVVELPRAATDREWQFLVAELRETFDAKGKTVVNGPLREWSNGNLHAVLEETEDGHRLRMGTRKGNALELNAMGLVFLAMAVMMTVAMLVSGRPDALFMPALFALGGAGSLVANRLRLPRWADERERQMERIAVRARELLAGPPQE